VEALLLRKPELGPFPLCLDSGPPLGTNPQLWTLYKADQRVVIVPVAEGSEERPQSLVTSTTLVLLLSILLVSGNPESSLPSQTQSQRPLSTYFVTHSCLSYYRNLAA
jgi:hypothetical protein